MNCPEISSAELLGVGRWGGFSSHSYPDVSITAGFCPGIFRFTRCVVRHLGYLLVLASQPCPIWTVSRNFLRVPFVSFRVNCLLLRPNSSGFSALVAGSLFIVRSSDGVMEGSCFSLCTFLSQGFSVVLGSTALRLQAMSQEVLYLPSVIIVLWRRRSLVISSLLSDRIILLAVFPRFLWGGEINIEVI